MLDSATLAALAESFRGDLITTADSRYDQACKLYNGMITSGRALIARCADVADVIATVKFARENDLLSRFAAAAITAPGWVAATAGSSSTCRP